MDLEITGMERVALSIFGTGQDASAARYRSDLACQASNAGHRQSGATLRARGRSGVWPRRFFLQPAAGALHSLFGIRPLLPLRGPIRNFNGLYEFSRVFSLIVVSFSVKLLWQPSSPENSMELSATLGFRNSRFVSPLALWAKL